MSNNNVLRGPQPQPWRTGDPSLQIMAFVAQYPQSLACAGLIAKKALESLDADMPGPITFESLAHIRPDGRKLASRANKIHDAYQIERRVVPWEAATVVLQSAIVGLELARQVTIRAAADHDQAVPPALTRSIRRPAQYVSEFLLDFRNSSVWGEDSMGMRRRLTTLPRKLGAAAASSLGALLYDPTRELDLDKTTRLERLFIVPEGIRASGVLALAAYLRDPRNTSILQDVKGAIKRHASELKAARHDHRHEILNRPRGGPGLPRQLSLREIDSVNKRAREAWDRYHLNKSIDQFFRERSL